MIFRAISKNKFKLQYLKVYNYKLDFGKILNKLQVQFKDYFFFRMKLSHNLKNHEKICNSIINKIRRLFILKKLRNYRTIV